MSANFETLVETLTLAGTPQQVIAQEVGGQVEILVKAGAGNTGSMFIGNSAAKATAAAGFTLAPNESVRLRKLLDTEFIWFDGATNGNTLEIFIG